MMIKINGIYTLDQLEQSGCALAFGREACGFSEEVDFTPPMDIHLLPLPDDWDCDNLAWAPSGFRALKIATLAAIGIEHPTLQETMQITATGAWSDDSPVSFPAYAYLGMREGKRVLTISGCGFVPFCTRPKYELPNLVCAFQRIG